jgi:sugar-specific transcriptional regulator TrmB
MVAGKDIAGVLQSLGFTEYEARAYLALLRADSLNGYEVAKVSAIPRANIYPVLERLVARGAARRLETAEATRYSATPAKTLLARLEADHRNVLSTAREALSHIGKKPTEARVFNLRNRDELLTEANTLLRAARKDLLVAIQFQEASALAPALAEARARGVAITTLCMEACASTCEGCVGDIHRYRLAPDKGARWLLLVADGRQLIAAEMRSDTTRAIATEQQLIVELATAYVRQSLALAMVAGALGERFNGLLSAEARRVLDGLHPDGGFIAYLERLVGGPVK